MDNNRTDKPALMDLLPEEMKQTLSGLGQPSFRAEQVMTWLHKGASFDEMSNLPRSLREELSERFRTGGVHILQVFKSARDDTEKFLYELHDGNIIEGVLMHYHHGYTLCVSTQVGCRMGCLFCASTLDGCIRNLSAGEILGQVIAANRHLGNGERNITNLVLMGSGEPLDNYDELIRFLKLVHWEKGLGISYRNISLSTCGLVHRMLRFAEEDLPVHLSLSLHAPNDELRRRIMPIAKTYGVRETIAAAKNYLEKTGRRIIIEYAMIGGLNDSDKEAFELAALLKGMQVHVNIIPLNDVPERQLHASTGNRIHKFMDILKSQGISVTRRVEMGTDIEGACGQLRRKVLEDDRSQS